MKKIILTVITVLLAFCSYAEKFTMSCYESILSQNGESTIINLNNPVELDFDKGIIKVYLDQVQTYNLISEAVKGRSQSGTIVIYDKCIDDKGLKCSITVKIPYDNTFPMIIDIEYSYCSIILKLKAV